MAKSEQETRREQAGWEPRQESIPYALERLTDEQQVVVRQVRHLVATIASMESTMPEHGNGEQSKSRLPDFARLDPDKRNRVILISGKRGAGKTSALLHLVDRWNHRWRNRGEEPGRASTDANDVFDDVGVVPLRLIDLYPIPPATHLLMHIVEVIAAAIPEPMSARSERRDRSLYAEAVPLPSRQRWRTLVRALATGWDQNSSQSRRGQLDPEAYAYELEEAERERLELHPTHGAFARFIDALCDDFREHHGFPIGRRKPLFVLGIDDADMNPQRAQELLQVLQLLVHPRLVFVLTGERDLFEEVMQNEFRKKLTDRQSRDLSINLCRKVMPFSQTFTLRPLSPEVRWKKLADALARVRVPSRSETPRTLREPFDTNPQLRALLPDQMRKLSDFVGVLQRGELLLALEELRPHDVVDRKLVELSPINESSIALQPSVPLNWAAQRTNDTFSENGHLREWGAVALRVEVKLDPKLPTELAEWLSLVADVVGGGPVSGLDEGRSAMGPYDLGVVEGVWWRKNERHIELIFRWPLPDEANALEISAFVDLWKSSTAASHESVDDGRSLLRRFLKCVIDVFDVTLSREPTPHSAQLDLLVDRIARMATVDPPRDRREGRGRRWALGLAGLLAAPESGLPPAVANDFLRRLKSSFGKHWDACRDTLRLARKKRIEWALRRAKETDSEVNTKSTIDDVEKNSLIEYCDAIDKSFDWGRAMTETTTSSATVIDALKSAMSAAGMRNVPTFLNRITDLGSDDLSPLVDIAKKYGSLNGAEDRLARELWARAVEIAKIAPDAPLAKPEAIVGRGVDADAFELPFDPSQIHRLNRLQIRTLIPDLHLKGAAQNRWLDALFKTLWDDAALRGQVEAVPWFNGYLPAIGGEVVGVRDLLGWPIPQWTTFADFEAFATAWGDMAAKLTVSSEVLDPVALQRSVVDWYVDACLSHIIGSRPIAFGRLSVFSAESFESRMGDHAKKIRQSISRPNSIVAKSLTERWLSMLPLIAAPESGLDGALAEVFYAHFREHDGDSLSVRPNHRLRDLRSRRFGSVLSDNVTVGTLLKRADVAVLRDPQWRWFFTKPSSPPA